MNWVPPPGKVKNSPIIFTQFWCPFTSASFACGTLWYHICDTNTVRKTTLTWSHILYIPNQNQNQNQSPLRRFRCNQSITIPYLGSWATRWASCTPPEMGPGTWVPPPDNASPGARSVWSCANVSAPSRCPNKVCNQHRPLRYIAATCTRRCYR